MKRARTRKGLSLSDLSYKSSIPILILTAYEERTLQLSEIHRIVLAVLLERELSYFDNYMIALPEDIKTMNTLVEKYGMFEGMNDLREYNDKEEILLKNFIAATGMLWDFMNAKRSELLKFSSDDVLRELLYQASTEFLHNTYDTKSFLTTAKTGIYYITPLDENETHDGIPSVLIRDVKGTSIFNCLKEFKFHFENLSLLRFSTSLRYIEVKNTSNGIEYFELNEDYGSTKLENFSFVRKTCRKYRAKKDANELPKKHATQFFRCTRKNENCALIKEILPIESTCVECNGRILSWMAWEWIDHRISDEEFENANSYSFFKKQFPELAIDFLKHFEIKESDVDSLYQHAWIYGGYKSTECLILNNNNTVENGNHRLLIAQRLDLKQIPYHYYSKEQKTDYLVQEYYF
ncbi:MAG: hypothetical protein Q8N88_00040 [Nanoarchaeota archaeon]|nr:hypothetical protein [Nanoarchaeota archaeon]